VVRIITMRIGTDVAVQQPHFTAFHEAIGVLQIHSPISGGFDFGAGKNKPRFKPFENLIVVKGLTIYRYLFAHLTWPGVTTVPGVAPSVPGAGGCCGPGDGTGAPTGGPTGGWDMIGSGLAPIGGGIGLEQEHRAQDSRPQD
jgi:hypothetical protein